MYIILHVCTVTVTVYRGPGQSRAATECLVQPGHKTRSLFLLYPDYFLVFYSIQSTIVRDRSMLFHPDRSGLDNTDWLAAIFTPYTDTEELSNGGNMIRKTWYWSCFGVESSQPDWFFATLLLVMCTCTKRSPNNIKEVIFSTKWTWSWLAIIVNNTCF